MNQWHMDGNLELAILENCSKHEDILNTHSTSFGDHGCLGHRDVKRKLREIAAE
jgi:hypothetical protein